MTAFQTKLSYTTSKVKSDSKEDSKSNPLVAGKSNSSKPVSNVPCDNNSSGYSDGEKSGLLGGDHSGFLGGSNNTPKPPKGNDHSGFLGGSNSNNNPKGNDHSGFLGGGNPKPTPAQPVVIQGTACNDTLRGNSAGQDTLVGTTAVARGVGERDVLIGGDASDTFVLGDTHGSFYVGKGNADYAEIQNFNRCNDGLQLAGSAIDYTVSYANGISSIYSNVGGAHDLIATVNSGCSAIDLTANYCHFVAPSCGSL
jgi:hypothetical protein